MSRCSTKCATFYQSGRSVTLSSEIFARVMFSRNFAYAKFRENITLAKG